MVQPAYKRRAVEDSTESDFQQLEDLAIVQPNKNVDVPDTHCVHEQNSSQLEGLQANMPDDIRLEERTNVTVTKVEMDSQSNSQSQALQDSNIEAPKTPQRQISSQQPITPRSQRTQRITSDFSIRSEPQKSPTPDEEIKPRMVMTRMVLNNFKSYAGRQNIGPFHKSFSAVVGPNGSGKSNVIDALLFVFGYRANKMRQGKLSELIHNSASYPDLDMCSVEVHFQEIIDKPGSEEYTVVDNSQLIVSRQAFRNNNSKYYINSKTSSFTEVTTLLKERGIDLDHKRFLILQVQ
ncbi:RecF/RecN/SMC N terminal domain-containing protein [Umbelopsis sp. PMI_123]|nr:RecF/RecN/SMC N terminal domain-containing protein [Umbelopsis sp. PMI_123]